MKGSVGTTKGFWMLLMSCYASDFTLWAHFILSYMKELIWAVEDNYKQTTCSLSKYTIGLLQE